MSGVGVGVQWLLVALGVVLAAGLLLRRRSVDAGAVGLALVIALAAVLLGLAWEAETRRAGASQRALEVEIPARLTTSPDREAAAYVSSDRCRACHPDQYASWHDSYHRTMTQVAAPASVLGTFDGQVLEARGRSYRLERRGDEYWVEMADPDWERSLLDARRRPEAVREPPLVWRRVVMTTGSHHMQTYWVPSRYDGRLFNFPWLWLVEEARWIPREEGFIRPPEGPRTFDIWHGACIECHAVAGEKNRQPSGRWWPEVAELGIACEACHGPAEEHVRANSNPLRRYRLRASEEGDPTIVNPRRLDAEAASQICGHCHGINIWKGHVRQTGRRYQPGEDLRATRIISRTSTQSRSEASHADPRRVQDWHLMQQHFQKMTARDQSYLRDRFWPDGMVRVSGREHNSFIESSCFEGGALSCLSCHSMHESDPDDQLAEDAKGGDGACLACHPRYGEDVEAHTHHAPDSSGSRCVNCHMPHTVYGLLKSIRSHWIDSPNATTTVETGRPSACELCHLDRSLGWVADRLEDHYGQPPPGLSRDEQQVASGVRWLLTGNAQQRALVAWHLGWGEAEEALAPADPGEQDWRAFFLGHLLDDPYPAVRYIASRSLRNRPSERAIDYDFLDAAAERKAARLRVMQRNVPRALAEPVSGRISAALLQTESGALDRERFEGLARLRDDTPMDLRE